jgi:hypothetical protein
MGAWKIIEQARERILREKEERRARLENGVDAREMLIARGGR